MIKLKNSKQLGYAAVTDDDGANYREIANLMTSIGIPMGQSTVHNHVTTIMQKFVVAFIKQLNIKNNNVNIEQIAKDPRFQSAIIELMQYIEPKCDN